MEIAIVTGGAKGIGAAIVKALAKQNIKVVLNYRTSVSRARELKQQLKKEGIDIEIYQADLSNQQEAKELVEFTKKKFGRIDILVNNAGISQIKMFTDLTKEDWDDMIKNNLNTVFYMTQEVVKEMIMNKKGCIINISSIWGMVGASCEVHYSVTKAAIDGMTKALAKELGPSNIRVNSIAPGIIDTEMNQELSEEEKKELIEQIPLNRIGNPKDIAKCVKWLIEDNYTTGQIISPNGGWII